MKDHQIPKTSFKTKNKQQSLSKLKEPVMTQREEKCFIINIHREVRRDIVSMKQGQSAIRKEISNK